MLFNHEELRRAIYVVAGILPATIFGVMSLLAIMVPPLILWTAAAWVGIMGLALARTRRPYDEIHGKTSLMLICGVIAMLPVTIMILLDAPQSFEWQEDYTFALGLLGSASPLFVAVHFLYFQASLLIATWLSMLIRHNECRNE